VRWAGHYDSSFTMKTYVHANDDDLKPVRPCVRPHVRCGGSLAGHGQTVAQRVAELFARARRAPIPALHANPPGELSYGDLLVSTFMPLRLPLTWPKFAADLNAAANGDASALETEARAMQTPEALSESTTSAAISCDDRPARLSSSACPQAIARFTHSGKLWGPVLGWWLWAPCASHWPAHSTDQYTGAVETPRPRPRSC